MRALVLIEVAVEKLGEVIQYVVGQGATIQKVETLAESPTVRRAGRTIVEYHPTVEAQVFKGQERTLNIPPQQQDIVAYLLSSPEQKATAMELVSGLNMKLTAIHSAVQKLRHTEPPMIEARVRE